MRFLKANWLLISEYAGVIPMFLPLAVKSNPITGLDRPCGFQEKEAPRFQDSRHMKVVRLSALRIGCFYPQKRLSQPQGHSGAGRIVSVKNSNDTVGN